MSLIQRFINWVSGTTIGKGVSSLFNKVTGSGLTSAESAQNEFNAQQAQLNREWETEMSNTSYQRTVADMQAAGVNPALAISQGPVSTPSGSSASAGASPNGMSFSDLIQLLTLKPTIEQLKASAQQHRDEGQAALANAATNARNAATNARNASVNEETNRIARYDAETKRMLADIERLRTDSLIHVNDEQAHYLAESAAKLEVERSLLPSYLDVAKQNASSQAKQASAALRSADAAVQNAATNDRLSDYQTSLMFAQEMYQYAQKEGQEVVNRYLDERQRADIDYIIKQGVHLDHRNQLIDKSGKLVDAQVAKTYIECGTAITHAACEIVGTATSVVSPVRPKIGF